MFMVLWFEFQIKASTDGQAKKLLILAAECINYDIQIKHYELDKNDSIRGSIRNPKKAL